MLAEEGRPIKIGALSNLERGQRGVDVDDLVALAVVLNVTPAQLLMPVRSEGEEADVELTEHRAAPWFRSWQWMCGDHWLDDARPPSAAPATQDWQVAEDDWHADARPHDVQNTYSFKPGAVRGHEAELGAVVDAARAALAPRSNNSTLSRRWLMAALNWTLALNPATTERA